MVSFGEFDSEIFFKARTMNRIRFLIQCLVPNFSAAFVELQLCTFNAIHVFLHLTQATADKKCSHAVH